MVIQMTNGSSSFNLNDICPSVPPDMMEACPYTFSEHTHNMIKQIPKIVPLDHPDYHQLVPPQARGKTNLYCAHPACTPNPCLNGGSCQETFADFDCNCTALYVGKRCEKRNTITDVKFLETGSRQGVVSFLPIKKDSPWEIMSFWGWEPSTSDLICKYLGYPGAYSTVDGVVLNSLPESAILGAKVVVCPGDAMIITDCWLTDEIPLEGTGVVGVICCEDYKCTSPGIPLGLENGDVIDTQITASSEDQTYKTATARLHGPQCWQPLIHDKLQWLQVDLLDAHLLTGLSMQGRVDEDYYVTAFSLKYSLMGTIWTVYKDEFKQVKYFSGNVNGSSVQTQSLYPGVVTRYVRIQPWAWEGQIAIRLELVGVGPIAAWDDVIKSNCIFDIDLCGWQQALDDDSDWLHQESRVPSHDSSPAHDHMDSYGAYVVMSSNSSINQTARLQSPPIKSQEGSNSSCLQFWTYVNGDSVGNLRVYVSNNTNVLTSEHLVFARSGNQGDRWIAAEGLDQ
ncbi:uncharacterized protein LOC121417622 [Lytechinus variegatus]|uniref:uncharacterized protein LOC121417622 n=1 Tax=Lytechinus variegatus TaxID=7654 RepID=UPI001BB209A2|nr:uncharacterized protein LOC121417622 [Lytechinus variegatus]